MPSKSYQTFIKNMETIDRLFAAYQTVDSNQNPNPHRGKRALDHITRAAEVFLVSTFEVYIEDALQECVNIHVNFAHKYANLPINIQGMINGIPHLGPNDKWIQKYRRSARYECQNFNTPKLSPIEDLFLKYAAIEPVDVSRIRQAALIDPIIRYRGEIVHRLRSKDYVKLTRIMFILSRILIPMLRFPTNGSGEIEKIALALDAYAQCK
jgi:hypothetical protein